MIEMFQNQLMKEMIEKFDFLPMRDKEGNPLLSDKYSIFTKVSYGKQIVVEILNGEKLSPRELEERLSENKRILMGLNDDVVFSFYEILIFEGEAYNEKLEVMSSLQYNDGLGKKSLNSISVDLSKKEVHKHFKSPVSDGGIVRSISKVLSKEKKENIRLADINELALKKQKEYEFSIENKTPVVTYSLIGLNILVAVIIYLYSIKSGISYSQLIIDLGAKVNGLILSGEYYRFITPIFIHASLTHLLVNCYSLYAVGVTTERIFGGKRFIAIYMFAGVLGNIASFMFSPNPGVGASGAIFGLLGALLYFGLLRPKVFKAVFGYNIFVTIVLNLGFGFSHTGIDNFAHIGGLIGGFLCAGIVCENESTKWYLNKYLYVVMTLIITIACLFYGFTNKQNVVLYKLNQMQKLVKASKWSEAADVGKDILKLSPEDTNIRISTLWYLTNSEFMIGKNDEALKYGDMLEKLSPSDGHYILGVIYYYNLKDYTKAKEELLEAKKSGADYEMIDKILNTIK